MRIADQLGVTCPVFYIDNVAEYLLSMSRDGFSRTMDKTPMVRTPFDRMWMEYYQKNESGKLYSAGAEISGQIIESDGESTFVGEIGFYMENGGLFQRERRLLWEASDTGMIDRIAPDGPCDEQELSTMMMLAAPFWLAIAFMHCKNVRHVEHVPGGAFERARKRRGEKPSCRYYTLEIDPMKETLRREGGIERVGLKQALHICRGHFKDYRQSGLFGKIKGIFWWDAAVRGSPTEGTVVKDYAIKAPEGTVH